MFQLREWAEELAKKYANISFSISKEVVKGDHVGLYQSDFGPSAHRKIAVHKNPITKIYYIDLPVLEQFTYSLGSNSISPHGGRGIVELKSWNNVVFEKRKR